MKNPKQTFRFGALALSLLAGGLFLCPSSAHAQTPSQMSGKKVAAGTLPPAALNGTTGSLGQVPTIQISGTVAWGTPGTAGGNGTYLISGGAIANAGGLNVTVQAGTGAISFAPTSWSLTTLTLATADPSNPRFDAIIDTAGTISAITGTAATNPAFPDVDPSTQLLLGYVSVPAGATSIGTVNVIYQEDAGPSAEWTASSTANVNVASTSNPYAGSKDIEFTSPASGNSVTLNSGTTINLNASYSTVSFYVRNKSALPVGDSVRVHWTTSGSATTGVTVNLSPSYGYTSTVSGTYQLVVIPISAFAIPSGTASAKLNIFKSGSASWTGCYIDNIQLEIGTSSGGGTTGVTSVNGLTGAVNVVAGSNVTVTTSGTSISIASTGGGGSGTVTSFSSGSLSPLFSASVANSTTTPALSFALSNASGYSWFGNASGSSGAPSYNTSVIPYQMLGSGGTNTSGQYLGSDGDWHTYSAGSSYTFTAPLVNTSGTVSASNATSTAVGVASFPTSGGLIASSGAVSEAQPITTIGSGLSLSSGTLSATGGGGSGTVNSGTSGQVAYYASTGTAVSGESNVTVAQGGTGNTTYTDGQLLIGDTSTTGLDKATLTAGSNVTITNGHGSITIAATAGSAVNVVTSLPTATSGNRGNLYLLEASGSVGTTTKLTPPVSMFATAPANLATAAFQLNEGTGTTTQEAANSKTGTLTSGSTWGTGDAGADVAINGTGTGITFADTDLRSGGGNCELMMRFKTTSTGTVRLFTYGNVNPNQGIDFAVSSNKLYLDQKTTAATGTAVVNDGNWHTVFLTYNGSAWSAYLDGSTSADLTLSCTMATSLTGTAAIGAYNIGSSDPYPLNGSIDFFYFFNTQLTTGQRSNLYSNPYSMFYTGGINDTFYISSLQAGVWTMQQINLP